MKETDKTVMVIAGGTWQVPLIKKVKAMGYKVLNSNLYEDSPGFAFSDYTAVADVKDKEKNLEIAEKYNYEIPKVSDVILNRYVKKILKDLSKTVPSLAKLERTVLTMRERTMEERGEVSFRRDAKGYVVKPRYDLVSSHTARRSGITNLYLTGLFDEVQMMSVSGHKDAKTFREYVKLSSDEIADAIAKKLADKENKATNEGLF